MTTIHHNRKQTTGWLHFQYSLNWKSFRQFLETRSIIRNYLVVRLFVAFLPIDETLWSMQCAGKAVAAALFLFLWPTETWDRANITSSGRILFVRLRVLFDRVLVSDEEGSVSTSPGICVMEMVPTCGDGEDPGNSSVCSCDGWQWWPGSQIFKSRGPWSVWV